MKDSEKTKDQLIEELDGLRARVARLEATRAEERLYQRLMRTLLDNVPDYVYFKDTERRFRHVSKSFCTLFHCAEEDILGKRDEDLFPKNVTRATVEEDRRVIETGVPLFNREEGGESIAGSEHWVLTTKLPWRDNEGNIIGVFGISREVTERKRAQEALRESEERLRTVVDAAPLILWAVDRDGIISLAEGRGLRALGLRPGDGVGQSVFEFYKNEPDVLIAMRRCLNGEEFSIESAVGGAFWENRYTPRRDAVGRVVGIIGMSWEITERKKLEEQFIQAQKMEAVGALAGGLAHDMNNVLAVVLGLGSVLEMEMGQDNSKIHDIRKIVSAARRGKSLVENLLGFARKGKYQREGISLNDIVRGLVEVLGRSVPKMVVINTQLDDQLAAVECDAAQMTQTVMNLCLNANDAIVGPGTITISTKNEALGAGDIAELEAGQYVKLQVKDNGTGMDGQTRKKAFEPFFTTKDVGKGSGLGLSMVYGVVKNHGGSVTIDSFPGEGTTVTVLLPAAASDTAEKEKPATEPRVTKGKGMVLLVDDEEMIRATGQRMLEAVGYEVVVAEDGPTALEIYRSRSEEIDLVLLDLSMPVMGGAECFEKLKEIDSRVRVLICTGFGSAGKVIGNGALDLVRKPFDLGKIAEAVGSALRQDD